MQRTDGGVRGTIYSLFPWILWRIWKSRNNFFFSRIFIDPKEIILRVGNDCEEWLVVHTRESSEQSLGNEPVRWKPPPHGWLKCNVDASWCANRLCSGVGWIIREMFYNGEGDRYSLWNRVWRWKRQVLFGQLGN